MDEKEVEVGKTGRELLQVSLKMHSRKMRSFLRFARTLIARARTLSASCATYSSSFVSILLKTIITKKMIGTSGRLAVHQSQLGSRWKYLQTPFASDHGTGLL